MIQYPFVVVLARPHNLVSSGFNCRMVFDASEEVGHWKSAFEDATSEGLSDDTVRYS